jgi:hypothetical protein
MVKLPPRTPFGIARRKESFENELDELQSAYLEVEDDTELMKLKSKMCGITH